MIILLYLSLIIKQPIEMVISVRINNNGLEDTTKEKIICIAKKNPRQNPHLIEKEIKY
jgi:hypothetical protein